MVTKVEGANMTLRDELTDVLDEGVTREDTFNFSSYAERSFDAFLLKQEMEERGLRLKKFLDKFLEQNVRKDISNKDIAGVLVALTSEKYPKEKELLASVKKVYDAVAEIVPKVETAEDFDTLMDFLNYYTYKMGTGRCVYIPTEEVLELQDTISSGELSRKTKQSTLYREYLNGLEKRIYSRGDKTRKRKGARAVQ